jgi:hypothetical protein
MGFFLALFEVTVLECPVGVVEGHLRAATVIAG